MRKEIRSKLVRGEVRNDQGANCELDAEIIEEAAEEGARVVRSHRRDLRKATILANLLIYRLIQLLFLGRGPVVLMKINLSPQRRDDTLELSRAGAVLTVNGEAFDFSQMAAGDTLPASAISSSWFAGEVNNIAGELELTLLLPLPVNFSPEQAFPEPLLNVQDGPVALPQPMQAPEAVQVGGFEE